MKFSLSILFVAISFSAWSQQTEETYGSLVPQKGYVSPFATRTACHVGDIVTILISEQSVATLAGTTTATKSDKNSTGPTALPILSRVLELLRVPELKHVLGDNSTAAASTVGGTGNTTANTRFTSRITAMVKEVLPNGNLVLEGVRWLKINKESNSLVLSGIVRRDDVRGDNTVLSESMANAKITLEGAGTIADRQRKGMITRILDWLF